MEKINTFEEGLNKLLGMFEIPVPDYRYLPGNADELCDFLVLDKVRIPLLWWRYHEKFYGMKGFTESNPGKNCCINVYSFTTKDESISTLLYRDIDIAEWLLGSRAKKITAFSSGDALNAIVVMDNETVANLELASTMPEGALPQCQHRLLTTNGMANDRVVDTVTVQSAINVFAYSTKPDVYTDLESWLYGLSPDDTNKVECAFSLVRGMENKDDFISADKHLRKAVKAALESANKEVTCMVEA